MKVVLRCFTSFCVSRACPNLTLTWFWCCMNSMKWICYNIGQPEIQSGNQSVKHAPFNIISTYINIHCFLDVFWATPLFFSGTPISILVADRTPSPALQTRTTVPAGKRGATANIGRSFTLLFSPGCLTRAPDSRRYEIWTDMDRYGVMQGPDLVDLYILYIIYIIYILYIYIICL